MTKSIPFLDLKQQYASIKKEVDAAINRVVDRQWFILGEETKAFEEEFAKYLGAKHVIGVGSGTEGLILALRALGVTKGDEVITPVNSFIATTLAITELGATPVLTDCDPDTYQIAIDQIESKISKRTRAILPVHLYGAPAPIDKIMAIAKKYKLAVIEDAAQAVGSTLKGKKLGTFGTIGVFSFYPGKNLGAYGDGGAVATSDLGLSLKLSKLRNYGETKKYHHDSIGTNSRLDEIQAAILRVKLAHLDTWNKKRNSVAKKYNELLEVKMQKIIAGGYSNYHIFAIESRDRDGLVNFLKENGVATIIHYPIPIHLQKCYDYLGYKRGDFPNSERLAGRVVSLPMYPELTANEVKKIAQLVNKYISR